MQKLITFPALGERLLRFVGDQLTFRLRFSEGPSLPDGWQARLRTNLGRAEAQRQEIIHAHTEKLILTNASWRDVPMEPDDEGGWSLVLPLADVGFFRSKPYALDPKGRQHWPEGADVDVCVHPDAYRTGNTIYCAFTRMFGETKTATSTQNNRLEELLVTLDKQDYTAIPPSGKLRGLIRELPHIVDRLGCRILHLLPVNPVPTTYARYGRFGSPYACQDLLAIDPALVEFDKRTTGVDQFRELTYAAHLRGARVFLDVVINHTGWGSTLQENHPEWFLRRDDGMFVSPGAWGVVWEDLVELLHKNPRLWERLADVFLEWCRRGVDGFRCDAGYKIPVQAWRYITARVLAEFPDTIFLLEGLGGSWEATEELLTNGRMQWAYSELFQNHSGTQIADYLDYSLKQSERVGLYVHYSETHDNDRLAAKGRQWSLLRNRLCALTSVSGGYGFTCGVEWLAAEKLQVHQSRGLSWDNSTNIIPELACLNRLLSEHPCFFDGATLARLSERASPVFALSRVSQEGKDCVLVLVNTDVEKPHTWEMEEAAYQELGRPAIDLLEQPEPKFCVTEEGQIEFTLQAGEAFCLSATREPVGLSGDVYRQTRAQSAWGITAIARRFSAREISAYNWRWLADLVHEDPKKFLAAIDYLQPDLARQDLVEAMEKALRTDDYPKVITWNLLSRRRVTPVPFDHWLIIEDQTAFRAVLRPEGGAAPQHISPVKVKDGYVACFMPEHRLGDATLAIERYTDSDRLVEAGIRFIGSHPTFSGIHRCHTTDAPSLALLTNGIGGMARLQVDLGSVQSKYDCLLGANLHPSVPVDRHIFAKRARVWINADGFITPLNQQNLVEFSPGPPARWHFRASAGADRAVDIVLTADMLEERNTTVLRFERHAAPSQGGRELTSDCLVSLTVRVDLEDRNFHMETFRNGSAEHHFATHTLPLEDRAGFSFTPADDRHVRVFSDSGTYHHESEWSICAHPLEATRGQVAHGDAYSPGWFELPIEQDAAVTLAICADATDPAPGALREFGAARTLANEAAIDRAGWRTEDRFGRQLALAIQAFVVRRGEGKTVIAGYPWFLDWGRDSLIAARGLLAAGMVSQVRDLLLEFGRFAEDGTLPNSIHGEDASNRDTSDAPLWYALVCEEAAALSGEPFYNLRVDGEGRTLADTLLNIASGYRDGTPNGIRMDPESALIWSPSHFTWMDTNYPAGTPREGYPVEIQVLWIRLLRQLERLHAQSDAAYWRGLAERAEQSFHRLYWIEERGYLCDLLIAPPGQSAQEAVADNALRSNGLFAVTLGLLRGKRARRCVEAAMRLLAVPGALRTLAPLPVSPPLPLHGAHGQLLNHPTEPYFGRYEGDEDTRRKPAYHNGTAWTWTFPAFCEALAKAWDFDPESIAAARTFLGSMDRLLEWGCVGQLPEIVDGDAPHTHRGCDAQAWSVTEALRVWKLLHAPAR